MTVRIDHRIASLSPERLTEIVEDGSGTIADTETYTYTFIGEDGQEYQGEHHVLHLADETGTEIGSVGFAVYTDEAGVKEYLLSDFWDERYPTYDGRTSWGVAENERGFVTLLAAFAPFGIF